MSSEEDAVDAVAMDRQRVMDCIGKLKEVIGDALPLADMEKLVRMADFDINRAINYFYNV